jgi:hypothetical protein
LLAMLAMLAVLAVLAVMEARPTSHPPRSAWLHLKHPKLERLLLGMSRGNFESENQFLASPGRIDDLVEQSFESSSTMDDA